MNPYKIAAVSFMAATLLVTGMHVASAQGAAQCGNQPNMWNALLELRNARLALERASADKGGYRVQAIQWADKAIHETERGCAFANGQ
jgi:hypothetical protein